MRKLLSRDNFDFFTGFVVAAILDDAINEGEQRVVAPHANVGPWMNLSTELAHQNIAGAHGLAAVHFDAPPLPIAISSIARAAACFFMCHIRP